MNNSGANELVFGVDGSKATQLDRVEISTLNLLERQHLQEWVLQNPSILGDDILIIGFEFDQWAVKAGPSPKDRLDVLGISKDGRLLVAELKRGRVPDTVELQAIKYAAMVSRFTEDQLAKLHMEFVNSNSPEETRISEEDAVERIASHCASGISSESLLSPRIVILAESFSLTVTASVVWLCEQGLSISLKQYGAYRTTANDTILTVSQVYPLPDAQSFEIVPRLRADRKVSNDDLPQVPWTEDDLLAILENNFPVPQAILTLCAQSPGEWIGTDLVYREAGVDRKGGIGRIAGFGYSVRTRFNRSNAPWEFKWAAGGKSQAYYRLSEELAQKWLNVQKEITVD
jgi:hypothetical protein